MRASTEPKLPRRSVVQAAVAGVALAFCGAATTVWRMQGYDVDPSRRLLYFAPWQMSVLEHAARRIAASDADDPESPGPAAPSPDDVDVAGYIDGAAARMHPSLRRDLARFVVYLEQLAPLACGYLSRFTRLEPEEQDRVLASLEASSHDLLRAGFEGLKALVFMGYYRHPRTWAVLGYDGPLLRRPPRGWY
jgi:hypothetical protein